MPQPDVYLLVSRHEADRLLDEQIAAGKRLHPQPMDTPFGPSFLPDGLAKIAADFETWRKRNGLILKRIFSNDDYWSEYAASLLQCNLPRYPETVPHYNRALDAVLAHLESLRRNLDLIPENKATVPVSESPLPAHLDDVQTERGGGDARPSSKRNFNSAVETTPALDWSILEEFEDFCLHKAPEAPFRFITVTFEDGELVQTSLAEARSAVTSPSSKITGVSVTFGDISPWHNSLLIHASLQPGPRSLFHKNRFSFDGPDEFQVKGLAAAWQKRLDARHAQPKSSDDTPNGAPRTPFWNRLVSRNLIEIIVGGVIGGIIVGLVLWFLISYLL